MVNLERLPDVPVDVSQAGLGRSVGDVVAGSTGDRVSVAEANAAAAAIEHQVEAYLPKAPPAGAVPAQSDELLGTWTSPFLTISCQEDGTFATRLPDGTDSEGRWSVDSDGRLRADLMGAPLVAQASVQGDELTLVINDQAIKLRRQPGS